MTWDPAPKHTDTVLPGQSRVLSGDSHSEQIGTSVV